MFSNYGDADTWLVQGDTISSWASLMVLTIQLLILWTQYDSGVFPTISTLQLNELKYLLFSIRLLFIPFHNKSIDGAELLVIVSLLESLEFLCE